MADIPESIGKYKIVSLVAKGGMGAVFKAVHPTLKRNVIIKKLTIRGNASIIERFKREAQILIDLNDPRIVHLFDYFKEGNTHYIVLEFVDGMSLDVLLRKRRYLSGVLSLYIFLDVCKALKYAHDCGIIHRDIKPGNILISKTGAVKLADFGIAATDEVEDDGLTKEGMTLGTASYMPPEQFKNSRNVDKRADVYAMGVMLYEMVTGKKPFPANFSAETIIQIQKGKFINAKKLNPDTPKIILSLIKKMIRANPKKRFQDMGPVIKIIEKYLKNYQKDEISKCLVDCMNTPETEEPVFRPRKKKRVVAITLFIFLLGAGAFGWYAWENGYVHKYILSSRYGAFKISMAVPESLKDPEDIFLRAKLYINDRKDYPSAGTAQIEFTRGMNNADASSSLFVSDTIYVKPGSYRLKIIAEQRIYWHTFTVESLASLEKAGKNVQHISLRFDNVQTLPITVRMEAFDAFSGRALTAATRYSVYESGDWFPLEEILPESLVTGTVRKFRAEKEGYYPEYFSLKVYPYQSELVLRANLVPLPGILELKAPETSFRLTINGSSTLILGGEDMLRESLEGYRGGSSKWNVPSGRYELEIVKGKKSVHTTFVVVPGETIKLAVTDDDGVLRMIKE